MPQSLLPPVGLPWSLEDSARFDDTSIAKLRIAPTSDLFRW